MASWIATVAQPSTFRDRPVLLLTSCNAYAISLKVHFGRQMEQMKVDRELHLRKAQSAKEEMKKDAEIGKTDNNITIIAFDLMKTLPTPNLSVGVCYYKRQLWTYCLGIHDLSNNDEKMYVWDESKASRGPQEVGSCIMHFVQHFVKSEKLIMYSDQCGGQNRNIKIAAICNYMVMSNTFSVKEIHHKCLVSGHSYLACDQDLA